MIKPETIAIRKAELEQKPRCIKVRYQTSKKAKKAISLMNLNNRNTTSIKRLMTTYYYCDDCSAYHLTTQKKQYNRDTKRFFNKKNRYKMNLPTIKWVCNADDDFVGYCNRWMLRVEQMHEHSWWWCVYYPNDHPFASRKEADFNEPTARTMNEAIDYATISFYFHYTETQ